MPEKMCALFPSMCDEKWIALHLLLGDETVFVRTLEAVSDPKSSHSQTDFIRNEFQTIENFAKTVDRWIRIQTQPFLGVKIVEELSLPKKDSFDQSLAIKVTPEIQAAAAGNRQMPKAKRISPLTISSSLPPNFGQSSVSNSLRSTDCKPSTLLQSENQWPSLAESTPKQTKVASKKKRITPTLLPQIPLEDSLVTLPPPLPPPPAPPPVPTLVHQMSTSVKSQFEHLGVVVEVIDSNKGPNDSYHTSLPHELGRDEHSLNEEDRTPTLSLARLAHLYTALVKSNLIPVIPTVLFLSRLLSSRHTCATIGKEIVVSIQNQQKFPSYFLSDFSLALFLTEASLNLADIIQSLGDQFCSSYAALVGDLSPIVSQSLLSRTRRSSSFTQEQYNELYPYLGQEPSHAVDREEYIRPFHEEQDNRHEYRSKVCHPDPLHSPHPACLSSLRSKGSFITSERSVSTSSAISSGGIARSTEEI
jgi:hypothetical protein